LWADLFPIFHIDREEILSRSLIRAVIGLPSKLCAGQQINSVDLPAIAKKNRHDGELTR
jgi:hypothetical protein